MGNQAVKEALRRGKQGNGIWLYLVRFLRSEASLFLSLCSYHESPRKDAFPLTICPQVGEGPGLDLIHLIMARKVVKSGVTRLTTALHNNGNSGPNFALHLNAAQVILKHCDALNKK